MKTKLIAAAAIAITALHTAAAIDNANPVALVAGKAIDLIEMALRFLAAA